VEQCSSLYRFLNVEASKISCHSRFAPGRNSIRAVRQPNGSSTTPSSRRSPSCCRRCSPAAGRGCHVTAPGGVAGARTPRHRPQRWGAKRPSAGVLRGVVELGKTGRSRLRFRSVLERWQLWTHGRLDCIRPPCSARHPADCFITRELLPPPMAAGDRGQRRSPTACIYGLSHTFASNSLGAGISLFSSRRSWARRC
jgi:hypothetical protein